MKTKKKFKEMFGTNPWDPWSTKANIAEGSGLNDFLKSRGMNPKTMDREQKSAWARSDAFKQWAQNRPVSSSTYAYKTASEETELEEGSLHDWFGKEKWVRMDTKGNIKGKCAREKGEGKPKCLPRAKAQALGKEGRAQAASRKRREDPNPERSGKAINVATKKRTNEEQVVEKWSDKYKKSINCNNPKGFSQKAHCQGRMKNESVEYLDEKKDACYHKVKSRYKVWPSAYASGALVKCRKKGAKNWGIKSEDRDGARKDGVISHAHRLTKRVDIHKPQGTISTEQLQVEPSESVLHDEPEGTLTKVTERRREMTKAARIIKSIYKKHRMSEELYDHEKDNKDPSRVKGKEPKLEKEDEKKSKGENKPQAAATLSGGKTMTGQERDIVEIDPMMRSRPGQPDPTKKDDKKKDDKDKNDKTDKK